MGHGMQVFRTPRRFPSLVHGGVLQDVVSSCQMRVHSDRGMHPGFSGEANGANHNQQDAQMQRPAMCPLLRLPGS